MDIVVPLKKIVEKKLPAITEARALAFELFRERKSIEAVAQETGRAKSTVLEYFSDYLERESPTDISAYISNENYGKIQKAIEEAGMERLKPIYIALQEKFSYDDIRMVVAHIKGKDNHHKSC
jgi:ATP-dependent DNA helicase RecQ